MFHASNGAWHYLAVTVGGTRNIVKVYLNGTKVAELSQPCLKLPQGYVKVVLGNDMSPLQTNWCETLFPERAFVGEISQFFMWHKVLSKDDIRYMYKNIYRETDFLIKWTDFSATNGVKIGCNDAISTCN